MANLTKHYTYLLDSTGTGYKHAVLDAAAFQRNKHPMHWFQGPRLSRFGWSRLEVTNDFDQLDATRAAGRARQRAGLLHLFADKV